MKTVKKLLCLVLCLTVFAGFTSAATAEEYKYTVRFFSGAHGTFHGNESIVYENLNYGDRVTFNFSSVTLDDGTKYYVKGIRESGRDNNTIGITSFTVTKDQDYVVAYGILATAVGYTVRHIDIHGNYLAPTENYYGNVGDKPVVAFQYIEGYRPEYYNITRTLTENAADNIFEFIYFSTADTGEPTTDTSSGSGGGSSGGSGGSSGGGTSGGGSSSATDTPEEGTESEEIPEDTSTPDETDQTTEKPPRGSANRPGTGTGRGSQDGTKEDETHDILDLDSPLHGREGQVGEDGEIIEETETPSGLSPTVKGLIIAGASMLAVGLLIFFIWKRRKDDDDEQ